MADLTTMLCGVPMRTPFVLASGIWGSSAETLIRVGREGAGAVTAKSCSLEPRAGHPNPTVLDWGGGLINAVGLANPGAVAAAEMLRRAKEGLASLGVALIASVFGHSREGYREAVRLVAAARPDLIELNISCPNVEAEFGRPFAMDPGATAGVTAAVREVYSGPLLVKLSPGAPDLVAVGRAALAAGADGLTAVNTMGPGMAIDVRARRPVLANRAGGVSGPALHPIAVRCVYDLAAELEAPIVGTGGVSDGEGALRMIMAGATAVGVGSALYREGPGVFRRLNKELGALMCEEELADLAAARGIAHGY